MNTPELLRKFRTSTATVLLIAATGLLSSTATLGADMSNDTNNFYHSEQVTIQKITFKNQYNMNVVGNLIIPKNLNKY